MCSFLLPKCKFLGHAKLLLLSKVICERQKIIQTVQIFQSEADVFLKKSKNYFCIYSIIFSIPDFCAILGRVSLSTLHSTNHALWSRCPFRFVVIEPSSLNASQPWHTLEVRIVWSHAISQSKSKHIGFAGRIKTIELFRDTQFFHPKMRGWEMQLKRFLQRFSACSSLHFTAIHTATTLDSLLIKTIESSAFSFPS